jgi:hypothetical protein
MIGLIFLAIDGTAALGNYLMEEFSKRLMAQLTTSAVQIGSGLVGGVLSGIGQQFPGLARQAVDQAGKAAGMDVRGVQEGVHTVMKAMGVTLVSVEELEALRAVAQAANGQGNPQQALARLKQVLDVQQATAARATAT